MPNLMAGSCLGQPARRAGRSRATGRPLRQARERRIRLRPRKTLGTALPRPLIGGIARGSGAGMAAMQSSSGKTDEQADRSSLPSAAVAHARRHARTPRATLAAGMTINWDGCDVLHRPLQAMPLPVVRHPRSTASRSLGKKPHGRLEKSGEANGAAVDLVPACP
jgi:hypothetical protein